VALLRLIEGSTMATLMQDVRFAIRMLLKNPVFTIIAMLTLALGIGANTAIFSLTDQVLLRRLPVVRPQELVVLRSPGPRSGRTWSDGSSDNIFSYPLYKDMREHLPAFSGLLARFPLETLSVSAEGQTAEKSTGELVSGNYFEVLGVGPAVGRVLTAEDETAPGANPVAVLSYGYWARRFGGDPGILNKPLVVNGTSLIVVGVSRAGFGGIQVGQAPDLFIPITMKASMTPNWDGLADRKDHWVAILGRLKPGFTAVKAQTALGPAYRAILEAEAPSLKLSAKTQEKYVGQQMFLDPGANGRLIFQDYAQKPLVSLLAMVGLILLITCANLASLTVARLESRQREVALRLALGANRWRLIRQLLTESLLLAAAGGAAGLLLAWWTLGALVGSLVQNANAVGLTEHIDYRVLTFAIALTIFTGVLFGFIPAARAGRADLQSTLKEQGRSTSDGRSNLRLRKWLMVSQVALTGVLLTAAGFFAQSLLNLKKQDLGLRLDHVIQFSIAPELSRYSPPRTIALFDRIREAIAALPGVQSVSVAVWPVLAGDDSSSNITVEGYAAAPDEDMQVNRNTIGPNYFAAMGTPLLAGREFSEADRTGGAKVVIINEKLARRFFAGRNPIGQRLAQGDGDGVHPDTEIVGVVKNTKHTNIRDEIHPFMYLPYSQEPALGSGTFYVRTNQDPSAMAATLRNTVQGFDSNLPVFDVRTLEEQANESVYNDRLLTIFSMCLGLLAALLAAIGLYGVLTYMVTRRTHELGIRMALGATKTNVTWLVLKEVVRMAATGLAIGLVAAFGLGRMIESQLFGVKASDPLVFAVSATLLAGVALLAGWLPARKAANVDPMVALRYE
jgi:predicted permease